MSWYKYVAIVRTASAKASEFLSPYGRGPDRGELNSVPRVQDPAARKWNASKK